MEQSTISIRIDSQLKKDFEEFCKNVGMNMTTAISIFATTVVKEQRIPFEISADPFYSEKIWHVCVSPCGKWKKTGEQCMR